MLEPDPLNGIGELDVDAEIVRVELQTVVGTKAPVFLDVHRECRHRTVERQLPVPVAAWMGLEGDRRGGGNLLHQLMLLRADSRRRKAPQTSQGLCLDLPQSPCLVSLVSSWRALTVGIAEARL